MITPLIIPNFNQKAWLIQLINWWNFATGSMPVFILDNASSYGPLLEFYDHCSLLFPNVTIVRYGENSCRQNLAGFLNELDPKYQYYCISNPDILPGPTVPENFLQILKHCLDTYGYYKAGFQLANHNIPDSISIKSKILEDSADHHTNKVFIDYEGKRYKGHKAAIDLTFAMYSRANGGWMFPVDNQKFGHSIRVFESFHLGWYIEDKTNNPEHINYFKTAKCKTQGLKRKDAKGSNSYRPAKYEGIIQSASTGETLAAISTKLAAGEKVVYSRFGDGDILIAGGQAKEKFTNSSPALVAELKAAIAYTDARHIKGMSINYPLEKGMTPGVFAPFEYDDKLAGIVKGFTKQRRFYNPILFHYLAVFEPEKLKAFLDEHVRGKRIMYIGCLPKVKMEILFGKIDYYVATPDRNSYASIESWWPEAKKNLNKVDIVIPATGLATRAVNYRILKENIQVSSLDIGSLVDAVCNLPTRTWIKRAPIDLKKIR